MQELNEGNWDGALLHIKGPLNQEEKESMVELLCSRLLGQEDFTVLLKKYLAELLALDSLPTTLRDNLALFSQVVHQDLKGASTFDNLLQVLEVGKKDPILRVLFGGDTSHGTALLDQLKDANLSLQGRFEKCAKVHDSLAELKNVESDLSIESFCSIVESVAKLRFDDSDLAIQSLVTDLVEIAGLVCERCDKAMRACNLTSILGCLENGPLALDDKAEFFESSTSKCLAFLWEFAQKPAVASLVRRTSQPHAKIMQTLHYFNDAVPCWLVDAHAEFHDLHDCVSVS